MERRPGSSVTAPDDVEPLHVVAPRRAQRSTRAGIVWHFCGQSNLTTVLHQGLLVTSAAQTWLHLSHRLTIDELVVLGDAMLRRKGAATNLAELRTLTDSTRKMKGLTKARAALDLVQTGTDSSMETRARLLLVHAGLPCPVVNRAAIDDQGRFLALPDMSYPERRIAIEYDGDVHRTDPATWRRGRWGQPRVTTTLTSEPSGCTGTGCVGSSGAPSSVTDFTPLDTWSGLRTSIS